MNSIELTDLTHALTMQPDAARVNIMVRMEGVACRCVYAVQYFEAVSKLDNEFWAFTQNCFGEMACLYWCHLFNSWDDDLHYTKVFGRDALQNLSEEFSCRSVKERICKAAGLDNSGYDSFRTSVVNIRDKYIAHKDETATTLNFPDINLVGLMCLEFREVLAECFCAAAIVDPHNSDYQNWRNYFKGRPRAWLLRKCENELLHAKIVTQTCNI